MASSSLPSSEPFGEILVKTRSITTEALELTIGSDIPARPTATVDDDEVKERPAMVTADGGRIRGFDATLDPMDENVFPEDSPNMGKAISASVVSRGRQKLPQEIQNCKIATVLKFYLNHCHLKGGGQTDFASNLAALTRILNYSNMKKPALMKVQSNRLAAPVDRDTIDAGAGSEYEPEGMDDMQTRIPRTLREAINSSGNSSTLEVSKEDLVKLIGVNVWNKVFDDEKKHDEAEESDEEGLKKNLPISNKIGTLFSDDPSKETDFFIQFLTNQHDFEIRDQDCDPKMLKKLKLRLPSFNHVLAGLLFYSPKFAECGPTAEYVDASAQILHQQQFDGVKPQTLIDTLAAHISFWRSHLHPVFGLPLLHLIDNLIILALIVAEDDDNYLDEEKGHRVSSDPFEKDRSCLFPHLEFESRHQLKKKSSLGILDEEEDVSKSKSKRGFYQMLGFLLLLCSAAIAGSTLIFTISYSNSLDLSLLSLERLNEQVTNAMIETIDAFVLAPSIALKVNNDLYAGEFRPTTAPNDQRLRAYFVRLVDAFSVNSIYVGTVYGGYVAGIADTNTTFPFVTQVVNDSSSMITWERQASLDNVTNVLYETESRATDQYNVTSRPWFSLGQKLGETANSSFVYGWTDLYEFSATNGQIQAGVTLVSPFVNSSGQVEAVFAVDVTLDIMSSIFSSRLVGNWSGAAFALNSRGEIFFLNSTLGTVITRLTSVTSCDDDYVTKTLDIIISSYGDISSLISSSQKSHFVSSKLDIRFQTYKSGDIQLLLVSVVDQGPIKVTLSKYQGQSIGLIVFISLLCILFGYVILEILDPETLASRLDIVQNVFNKRDRTVSIRSAKDITATRTKVDRDLVKTIGKIILLFFSMPIAVLCMVSVFGIWSGAASESTKGVADVLVFQSVQRISSKVNDEIVTPGVINKLSSLLYYSNFFDLQDSNFSRPRRDFIFQKMMDAFSDGNGNYAASFIYIGVQSDGLVAGAAKYDGNPIVQVTPRDLTNSFCYSEYNPILNSSDPLLYLTRNVSAKTFEQQYCNYEPRSRPWYKAAVSAKKTVWNNVYAFASNTVGITLSAPIYDVNETLVAVFAVDLKLSGLTQLLQSIDIVQSATSSDSSTRVFIIQTDGTLLAVSTGNVSQTVDGVVTTVKAVDHEDDIISSTASVILSKTDPDVNSFSGTVEITRTITDPLTFETAITEDAAQLRWVLVLTQDRNYRYTGIEDTKVIAFLILVAALIVSLLTRVVFVCSHFPQDGYFYCVLHILPGI
jgi:hypothetical protein